MRKLAVVPLLLVACSSSGGPRLPSRAQGEPVLEVRGALKSGPHALGRADLAALPQGTVRGVDPATGREALWEGVSLAAIVSERVELEKGADTVVVRTADGGAVPIPLTVVRTFKPVIADRADGAQIASPLIAWPSREQRGLESEPRATGWWARDVVALELVVWEATFAEALAAPEGASDAARRGAGWYGERCINCHELRGVGGARGPDLTTVAARLRPGALSALLERHPGWYGLPGDPPSAEDADELWSFLRAVAATSDGAPPDALRAERLPPAPNTP
jgi:mono/diheme cytochrome c family protein